ncbi:hypothetical protein FHX37_4580 [Haloactinospora alba]|uniref:Uncharacterized protein n=2 Tax=Haloactinospora alba TaxID=405555 RepID=A0A543N7P4_9ACTN|nr:hypothetical protein FHX37_4580 [Haloactinospora alba]
MVPDTGQRPAHPRPHPRRGWRARWPLWSALAWSAGTVVLALAWANGVVPHPYDSLADRGWAGSVLTAAGPAAGTRVVLALGLAGAACAVLALRGPSRPAARRAVLVWVWATAAVTSVLLVHGALLALLGYSLVAPVLGVFVPGMWSAYVATVATPGHAFVLHCVLGGLLWGWAALTRGREVRGACVSCGRGADWTPSRERATRGRALRAGRVAVSVAAAGTLVYPALRLPWVVGLPVAMDASGWETLRAEPGMIAVGVGLGTAALCGVVLMLGLVRDWGVRFPRWMVGLAGRRVPVSLAALPAGVVALGFTAQGRGASMALLLGEVTTPVGEAWVHVAALAALLPGGLALGAATAAYVVRRRAACRDCGRGLPEQLPGAGVRTTSSPVPEAR